MDSPSSSATVYRKPKVLWSRLKWRWPFFVWLLAVFAGFWIYNHGGRLERTVGAFEFHTDTILAPEEARIKKILVKAGDQVKAGQPVAELDATIIEKEIADAEATVANENEQNRLSIIRTFQSSIGGIERELRDLRLRQAEDDGRLKTLRDQIKLVEQVVNSGALTRDVLVRLQTDLGGLEKTTVLLPTLISQAEQSLAESRAALAKELATLKAPVAPVAALKARLDTYTLRAPRDGIVHNVFARDGQVVLPRGQSVGTLNGNVARPIMDISATGSVLLHAFIAEDSKIEVTLNQVVTIYNPQVKGQKFKATINFISPYIETKPDISSPVPGRFVHGREITLMPEGDHKLIPGQLVSILYTEPSWFDLVTH